MVRSVIAPCMDYYCDKEWDGMGKVGHHMTMIITLLILNLHLKFLALLL